VDAANRVFVLVLENCLVLPFQAQGKARPGTDMEGLEQLDVVGDISPALEATEDFIHCIDRMQGQGPSQAQTNNCQPPRQPKQLPDVSSAALGKLSSSGVWGLFTGEQPEVGPLGLAWADNFSVLGLGMGLRHGKRSRARSTNDLAAHTKECTNNTGNASSSSVLKKGHNRSRSDVNYRPSAYTDNGLPAVDSNTLKNMILNHQQEGEFTCIACVRLCLIICDRTEKIFLSLSLKLVEDVFVLLLVKSSGVMRLIFYACQFVLA